MSDHEIINSWELVQTERERWADKLAPKHIPGDDCCTYGECVGGHGCPVRETPVEQLVRPVLDLPAPKYCERTKQNCNTPWTCSSQCRVIDSQLPVQMFEPPRWYHQPPSLYFFAIVGALIGFEAAVYQTF